MATNEEANNLTAFGMTLAVGALLFPPTAPAGVVGIIIIPIARGIRYLLDKQAENTENNKTEEGDGGDTIMMRRGLPMARTGLPGFYDDDDDRPLCPSIYSWPQAPSFSSSPEDTIARVKPHLAVSLLRTQSGNTLLGNLANSSVATEFARQGRGTRAGVRTRRSWLTGSETTEAFIEPI
ncbi:MAG: hypothetical protein PHR36_03690 [Patescibacteria group bacterium]|nr:hypothetical protein [Patescibacteria group bacterium]